MSIIWVSSVALAALLVLARPGPARAFWDMATTTENFVRTDTLPRTSFFRWQKFETFFSLWASWASPQTVVDNRHRQRLTVVAGISIDFQCLSTAILLTRRALISSANYLDPYMSRVRDLRIWALGREGQFNTPYRYRVWRARRLIPKSLNPEHWHGQRGVHSPRHDVAIIHSFDIMYIYTELTDRYMYPFKASFVGKTQRLGDPLVYVGSGYEYLQHIKENYKIFYGLASRDDVVNCERYLPKWWGKFICLRNVNNDAGVQNGGGLFTDYQLVGLGCFEIRYNEDRVLVFTDLRYYMEWILIYANYTTWNYEYAYPQWSVRLNGIFEGWSNQPTIPAKQVFRQEPWGK